MHVFTEFNFKYAKQLTEHVCFDRQRSLDPTERRLWLVGLIHRGHVCTASSVYEMPANDKDRNLLYNICKTIICFRIKMKWLLAD